MTTDEAERAGSEEPPISGLRARLAAAPVTVGLMVACLVAFTSTVGLCAARVEAPGAMLASSWLQLEACSETLADLGALRLADVWIDGSWWRVITAGLLHGSWLHLVLNTWSLWVVGEWVESTWGHVRAGVLFLLASVAGCLACAAWVEAPMVVGASAGIMGMAGALLVGRLLGRGDVGARLQPISAAVLGGWLTVLVALGFFVDVIAQAGHLGGLIAGACLGLAWSGRGRAIRALGWLGLALGAVSLVLVARHPERRPRYDEYIGYGYLERDMDAEAAAAFDRVLARRPEDAGLANAVAYALANEGTELERAEGLVRRALETEPDNADFLDTLGWVLCQRGEVAAGMVELRRASEASEGEVAEIEAHLVECGADGGG